MINQYKCVVIVFPCSFGFFPINENIPTMCKYTWRGRAVSNIDTK